jgi:hypothetical protein
MPIQIPAARIGAPKRKESNPLDWAIFIFLVITALATAAAACYTRKQWLTASDTERRQLRAYVVTDAAAVFLDEGKVLKSVVDLKNSG